MRDAATRHTLERPTRCRMWERALPAIPSTRSCSSATCHRCGGERRGATRSSGCCPTSAHGARRGDGTGPYVKSADGASSTSATSTAAASRSSSTEDIDDERRTTTDGDDGVGARPRARSGPRRRTRAHSADQRGSAATWSSASSSRTCGCSRAQEQRLAATLRPRGREPERAGRDARRSLRGRHAGARCRRSDGANRPVMNDFDLRERPARREVPASTRTSARSTRAATPYGRRTTHRMARARAPDRYGAARRTASRAQDAPLRCTDPTEDGRRAALHGVQRDLAHAVRVHADSASANDAGFAVNGTGGSIR